MTFSFVGEADGIADVEAVFAEQGIGAILATLRPGHVAWDEAARNAGAARSRRVPEEHEQAYYDAYARAARRRAEEIVADEGT